MSKNEKAILALMRRHGYTVNGNELHSLRPMPMSGSTFRLKVRSVYEAAEQLIWMMRDNDYNAALRRITEAAA